jgi:hypothetical protein
MGKFIIRVLFFVLLFVFRIYYVGSPVYAQNESQERLHDELPRADQCSIITMNIRQLMFELKESVKEKSRFEHSPKVSQENIAHDGQQLNEYEQSFKMLQEKISSLRTLISKKEQQLESCLQISDKSLEH